MNNSKIFDVYNENTEILSSPIPFISFATQEQRNIAESYVLNEADHLFRNMLNINEPIEMIPYCKAIGYQDFHQVKIDYFYNNLFYDLGERDSSKKLIKKLKWSITFDKELTPIQDEARLINQAIDQGRERGHNERKYGFISINGEPIFYYLHFTLEEILNAINNAINKNSNN